MQVRLVAALLAAAIAVAGWTTAADAAAPNGESAKPAGQIVADALAAAIGATAVHVKGSGRSGGKPLALDLHLIAGTGGKGTVTTNGLSFDIIRIGAKAYFRGNSAFWSHFGGSAAAQLFKGKWLMASATKGDLASFTPLTNLVGLMKQTLGSHGKLETRGTTTVRGQRVVKIVDTSEGGTLYVAATGPPYPIELSGTSTGRIDFDLWNRSVPLAAPKHPIDYAKLTKK